MYDRDAEISFHRYTDEEIIEFKTLMRHVAECLIVALNYLKRIMDTHKIQETYKNR